MQWGKVKKSPEKWYLSVTHQHYEELLQRIRLLPEYKLIKLKFTDVNIRNLSRMYYFVPSSKVDWEDDEYSRDVKYSLWSALRQRMSRDEYENLTHIGTVDEVIIGKIKKALFCEKVKGLGEAVENCILALKNKRNLEYADYDELRRVVIIILKTYARREIELLNKIDREYEDQLIDDVWEYIDEGIERLTQDFVDFWTLLPDRKTPFIVQRYAVAQKEKYIRGRRNKYGKPIGGLLYDFGERYLKYRRTGEIDRINRIEINTEDPEIIENRYIADAFVNSIVDRLDVETIFDNIKIKQGDMTKRQKIILYEMISSGYYRASDREGWISGIEITLAEHNIRGRRATIYNEIRKIEAIVGDIAIDVLPTDNLRLPKNVYRGLSKYLCTHETFESRVEDLNPYVEVK